MWICDPEVILLLEVRGVVMQDEVFLVLLARLGFEDGEVRLCVDLFAGKSRVLPEGLVAAHEDVIIRSFYY